MAKKFSFIIVGNSGKYIRRADCSLRLLYAIVTALILILPIITWGAIDYFRLSRLNLAHETLQTDLILQKHELVQSRQQIQKFAEKINLLKRQIVEINQMDQVIRRVAGVDESCGLFGVGGSVPEDLNYDIELERKPTRLIRKMHQQIEELQKAAVYQKKSSGDLWKVVEERGDFMVYTPIVQPADGYISSEFGYRLSPFTGKREFHQGVDIANGRNTEIRAPADGRISYAGKEAGYGNLIVINHGHGLTTRYAHLEKILFKQGDKIKRGDTIAYMGNTGRSTGTHLHYEVRLNGIPINPKQYFLH